MCVVDTESVATVITHPNVVPSTMQNNAKCRFWGVGNPAPRGCKNTMLEKDNSTLRIGQSVNQKDVTIVRRDEMFFQSYVQWRQVIFHGRGGCDGWCDNGGGGCDGWCDNGGSGCCGGSEEEQALKQAHHEGCVSVRVCDRDRYPHLISK